MSRMLCATLCHTIVHATMCQLSWIGSIFRLIYLNRIFTTCIWDVSIVNIMLYCLICLSFFKYRFDGFQSLPMCSRPYIFVFEITGIPASFSFPKIPNRFCFRWKKCENENDGVFCWSFPTVFIHSSRSADNVYGRRETDAAPVIPYAAAGRDGTGSEHSA